MFNPTNNNDQSQNNLYSMTEGLNNRIDQHIAKASGADKQDPTVMQAQQEQRQRLGIPVTEQEWDIISNTAINSGNQEETLTRFATALAFSREYDMDLSSAYANLDNLYEYQLGQKFTPAKTTTRALLDSFQAGRLNMEYSDLAYKFKQADLAGEDTTELLSQLDAMGSEIDSLKDNQPRNVATTALKWTLEGAVPYMMEVGKSALAGATFAGGLGTAFTAATGVGLGSIAAASPYTMAAIIAAGGVVGAVNRTRELMEGVSYLQLRDMGIDKDIANIGSRTYGLLVGAIEAGLGIEAGTVVKAAGGSNLVSSAASKVMTRFTTSGKLGSFLQGLAALGINATGEAVEEMIEEPLDYLVRHTSYAIQDSREKGSRDPLPDEELIRNTLHAGLRGFASAIVLGGPSAIMDTKVGIDQQAAIRREAAAVPSKEAFVSSMKQQKPETITTSDWDGAMSDIWEKEHSGMRESSAIESDENAIAELDAEKSEKQATGKVRRLQSGDLYTQEASDVTVSPDGTENRRMLVGDPATSSRYGYIDYGLQGNTLTIDDVLVKSGYESIRKEAVLSLAKKYPGYDIQWEPKSESLTAVRDEILAGNPRGQEGGLQYWDGLTDPDERVQIERQIESAMPNLSAPERAVGATLIQMRAEAAGMNTQAYLDASYKDGQLFGNVADLDANMQGKRGAVAFDEDLKAIIYAGQKADFSTFAHETFHVSLRQMGQLEQFRSAVTEASQKPEFITWLDEHAELFADSVFEGKNAQDLADIAAGFTIEDWGRTQEEFAARLYEGYLADGKTASGKLQQLFSQIAKWMAQIYTTLKHTVDLDQRIIEVFDSLYDSDSPLASQLVTQESVSQKQEGAQLYQSDTQAQYDAVVEQYRNTDQWMKAPNGKSTNLTERQWVQVRTPAFLEWFGDWINDPENASKVLDENGEPLVVYHGTDKEFSEFDRNAKSKTGHPSSRLGFFFTKSKELAEGFSRDNTSSSGFGFANTSNNITMPLFLNIRNQKVLSRVEFTNEIGVTKTSTEEYGFLRTPEGWADLHKQYVDEGYDGIKIERDRKYSVPKEYLEDSYVAFSPTQIKSATGNSGAFDTDNPNILFQEAPPTDSAAFKAWFGDSKVVDENGNPLVVYHGSRQWFEAFNDGTEKKHSKAPKGSIFATSSRKVAGSYYDYWGGTDPDVILEKDSPLHQNYSWGTYRKGGVYSLYMKIENPLIIDLEGKLWDEGDYDINEITKRAKSEGYDGVIAKNIRDIGFNDIPRDEYGNYQDTIATDYIAFNSTQVKATSNRGTWDAGNSNILYQEAEKKINNGTLAVLHNITAEKLTEVDKIGGLPSPSLAITKPNIPFTQFGEITLIADPSVAVRAMEESRLYDRDIWSPTVPRAEWKINQKVIDKFDKKIIPVIYKETGKYFSGSDAFSSVDINRGVNSLADAYKRNLGAQIAFLKDRGIDYELKFKKQKPPLNFPIEIIEENLEYFKSNIFGTENYDTVSEYLRPKVNQYLEKSLAHRKENNPALYENMKNDSLERYLRFGVLDKVFNFAKSYDKDTLVFDEYGTQENISQTIKDNDSDFTSWIKDNIKEAYSNPKIKIGSKKYDYTAENILKWMQSQSQRASQETMTYGPSKAAANAGRAFWNRKEVSESEDFLVTREEQQKQWVERIEPITEQLQDELPNYHKYGTWEALDSIYEAIGRYIEKYGSVRNSANMRKELSAKSFTKVPNYLIEKALDLVGEFTILSQDYFEAKPDRVVSLDEFSVAIIPETINEKQRSVLDKYGITAIEYVDENNRQQIVEQVYEQRGASLLFQDDLAFTESILNEARGFESWQELKAFYEAFADPDNPSSTDDSWYQEVFNQANGITEDADTEQLQEATRQLESEQAKDQYMKDQLATDDGVYAFLRNLGWMLDSSSLQQSAGNQQTSDAINNVRNMVDAMHPTIISNALRAHGGKRPTASSIKRIRTIMTGDAIRYYRDIYADVMEDEELRPEVIDSRLPDIEDPGYRELETMSITERIKLANRIEATELKKKILSGKETFNGAAEKVIKDADVQIAELNQQISDAEEQIRILEKNLSEEQQRRISVARDYRKGKAELDEELAKLRKLNNDGKAVPKAQSQRIFSLQKSIAAMHSEVMKMRKDARLDATIKKHEAVAKLREQLAEKRKEAAEAKQVREYKIKLARKIMVKPSDAINYEQAKSIFGIQALIDPNFRRDGINVAEDGQRVKLTLEEAQEYFSGTSEDEIINAIGRRNYERLVEERKPLNDWTINELEELANEVAELRHTGRRILAAKRERQVAIAQQYQDSIIRSLMATGKYTDQPIVGTREDQAERQSPKRTLRAMYYATYPMRVKAMMLDGDKQGDAYNLLMLQKRNAQAREWVNVERRLKPFYDAMKELGFTYKDLYETVPIDLDMQKKWNMSYSQLMYGWLSQYNEDNRNAISYGTFVTQEEKASLSHDSKLIQVLGDQRYNSFLEQAEYYLYSDEHGGKYGKLLEVIRESLNGDAERINEVAIREFNKPMRNVEQYLPILRLAFNGEDMAEQVAEDLFNQNAGGMRTSVEKGFMTDRIFISPDHQKPVNMDLISVLDQSVRNQEHFIAFAEYGRKLNRVFKDQGAEDLRHVIGRTLGSEMVDDINDYITQVINPVQKTELHNLQKGIRFMRGNLGAAYLSFKPSSVLLQLLTSPWPSVIDVKPKYLIQGYLQLLKHPVETVQEINERSPMMKNRTMNVIIDEILKQARAIGDPKIMQQIARIQEVGSLGLTYADRYSVAGQWMGAFHQRMDELNAEGIASEKAEQMATVYADNILLKTQPTGDRTELAPLFNTRNEFVRSFIQFTTSLNVIWSNITYDMRVAANDSMNKAMPDDVRKTQFSKVIGTLVGYGMAGLLLGAVMEGHDEDDDKIDKLRNYIYWSFTQGADSVPLIGSQVSELIRSAVTGDNAQFYSDDFYPGMTKILNGAKYLTQGDISKALENFGKGAGYMVGLPVSGAQQIVDAVREGPEALIGR